MDREGGGEGGKVKGRKFEESVHDVIYEVTIVIGYILILKLHV